MKSVIIVIIAVALSIGGVFLLKDNFVGPQGEQGLQGIQGERGLSGISVETINPIDGKWQEFCMDGGKIAPAAFWCDDPIFLWSK